MARERTCHASICPGYANNGVHDATAAYELSQAWQQARWLAILAGSLAVLLAGMLRQNQLDSRRPPAWLNVPAK